MCQLVKVKTNYDTEIEVAEMKKGVIENIIDAAGLCANISQIIMFGSVIESRCTDNSDIDLIIVSDVARSRLYKNKGYQEFLRKLHEKDHYEQLYDVICVHGMEELYRNKDTTELFQTVLKEGKTLYRRC